MSFGSKGGVTVRLTVRQDDGSLKKVLTGTSYKRWYVQATEYIFRVYGTRESGWQYRDVVGRVVGVERSNSPWIGWGGLKWCDEDIFQQELNREGCQQGEPDNPNPRRYEDFTFNPWPYGHRKLLAELGRW
jgi:hypothetical protein